MHELGYAGGKMQKQKQIRLRNFLIFNKFQSLQN